MHPVGGVTADQLKLTELEVVEVTARPVGAAVTALQVAGGVAVEACAETGEVPKESTAATV